MGVIHSQATATITVANSTTVSAAIYVGQKVPISLQMPATFTGATIGFQGSYDNVTYQTVNSGGAAYTEQVAASKDVALNGDILKAFPYLKLVSGSAEGADRVIVVLTRRLGR